MFPKSCGHTNSITKLALSEPEIIWGKINHRQFISKYKSNLFLFDLRWDLGTTAFASCSHCTNNIHNIGKVEK